MGAERFFRKPDFQLRALGTSVPEVSVSWNAASSCSRHPVIVTAVELGRTSGFAIDSAAGAFAAGSNGVALNSSAGAALATVVSPVAFVTTADAGAFAGVVAAAQSIDFVFTGLIAAAPVVVSTLASRSAANELGAMMLSIFRGAVVSPGAASAASVLRPEG